MIIKDILSLVMIFGMFYGMGRDVRGNKKVDNFISEMEIKYSLLNVRLKDSSVSDGLSRFLPVYRYAFFAIFFIFVFLAKYIARSHYLMQMWCWAFFICMLAFDSINRYLNGVGLNWKGIRRIAFLLLTPILLGLFCWLCGISVPSAIGDIVRSEYILKHRDFSVFLNPLIFGILCSVFLYPFATLIFISIKGPYIVLVSLHVLFVWLIIGVAKIIDRIDPSKSFAWILFFACAIAQIVSNHL